MIHSRQVLGSPRHDLSMGLLVVRPGTVGVLGLPEPTPGSQLVLLVDADEELRGQLNRVEVQTEHAHLAAGLPGRDGPKGWPLSSRDQAQYRPCQRPPSRQGIHR